MSRIVVLGLAMFFAIVGIALLGGDSKAMAFGHHKCCSCNSCNGCSSCNGCHRSHGCHKRCHGRCHGCNSCNGCNGGCCGGGYVQAPEKQAPAPAQVPAK